MDSTAQIGFEDLKLRMTKTLVLAMPDFSLPFKLETDASNTAIGAVLIQQNHLIAFFSKKMSKRMCASSTYVRELFAITAAVAKWRHYLLGITFVIKTDHRSLKHLMDQVIQTPEQHQYLSKLLGFNYTIVYKPEKEIIDVDALSRIEEDREVAATEKLQQLVFSDGVFSALITVTSQLLEALRNEVLQSSELQAIVKECTDETVS